MLATIPASLEEQHISRKSSSGSPSKCEIYAVIHHLVEMGKSPAEIFVVIELWIKCTSGVVRLKIALFPCMIYRGVKDFQLWQLSLWKKSRIRFMTSAKFPDLCFTKQSQDPIRIRSDTVNRRTQVKSTGRSLKSFWIATNYDKRQWLFPLRWYWRWNLRCLSYPWNQNTVPKVVSNLFSS